MKPSPEQRNVSTHLAISLIEKRLKDRYKGRAV